MANWYTNFRARFSNGWLFFFNLLGLGYNMLLLGYIVVTAIVAFFMLARPWAFYAAPLWGIWVLAAAWHAMIFFHFPSGVTDNVVTTLAGLAGAILGGLSWGYYWPYWLGCVADQASLNSIQLDTCLDAPWLVWMVWIAALLVTIGGSATAAICAGNAIVATGRRRSKRMEM